MGGGGVPAARVSRGGGCLVNRFVSTSMSPSKITAQEVLKIHNLDKASEDEQRLGLIRVHEAGLLFPQDIQALREADCWRSAPRGVEPRGA